MTDNRDRVVTTLGDLTPNDRFHEVTVSTELAAISGSLTSFELVQDWIDVTSMSTPPEEQPKKIRGASYIRISIGEWVAEQLPPHTRVVIWR